MCIQVREIGDGDFQVVRGGDAYVRWQGRIEPTVVWRGERLSAAAICEMQEIGVIIEDVGQ